MADSKKPWMQRAFSSKLNAGQWQKNPGQKPGQPQSDGPKGPNGEDATPENFTMLQAFEWYVPDDHKHWQRIRDSLPGLKAIGVDNVWIPPACKASGPSGNGYDIYDLYDLGEFDAKGGVATKWGTKKELGEVSKKAEEVGIGIYFDAVLNHKAAADHPEKCRAQEVDNNDRTKYIGDVIEIEGWLGFDFPSRGDKYSSQKYHWYHFSGTDYDNNTKKTAIYKILGDNKAWSTSVDTEKGNYDYLMFADLDYSHPEVVEDVKNWGVWIAKELKLKGFRFDAIKHYSEDFLLGFIQHLDESLGEGWFLVGEFWKSELSDLTGYLERMKHKFSLFDAPLVYKFSSISQGDKADLRQIFDGTLVQCEPYNAVTLVMNHDTQPSQALAAPVSDWFIPHAYSLILLRESGYPCLFYGDLYGLRGGVPEDHLSKPTCQGKLPDLVLARKLYAYGEQNDYFDDPNLIGWVRRGAWDKKDGMAVVVSNADVGEKRMFVGEVHKGEKWTDVMGWESGVVEIDGEGWGTFPVGGCSVSCFVNEKAEGRERFGKFDSRIYG